MTLETSEHVPGTCSVHPEVELQPRPGFAGDRLQYCSVVSRDPNGFREHVGGGLEARCTRCGIGDSSVSWLSGTCGKCYRIIQHNLARRDRLAQIHIARRGMVHDLIDKAIVDPGTPLEVATWLQAQRDAEENRQKIEMASLDD